MPSLKESFGDLMETVLSSGEHYELVPYGNHSRGAKFLDLTDRLTPELLVTIDRLCKSIPGFYYGRLDIRFSDFDQLASGSNFSVIEVNGAGSEPTHIYDPRHSVFFAWREIKRHLDILFKISKQASQLHGLRLMTTYEGVSMLRENRKHLRLLSGSVQAKEQPKSLMDPKGKLMYLP